MLLIDGKGLPLVLDVHSASPAEVRLIEPLLDKHDVPNIVQEVFRVVATHLDRFRRDRPGDTFRGWLITQTRTEILAYYRRRSKEQGHGEGGTDPRAQVPPSPYESEPACIDAVEKARAVVKDVCGQSVPSEFSLAPAPQQIGPSYRILSLLGQGGMGAVYKAFHTKLDKVVALKVLTAGRLRSEDAISRFEREMMAIGRLDHPHLIRALDAGEADGTHYLAMEYVDGVDLSALLRQRGHWPSIWYANL